MFKLIFFCFQISSYINIIILFVILFSIFIFVLFACCSIIIIMIIFVSFFLGLHPVRMPVSEVSLPLHALDHIALLKQMPNLLHVALSEYIVVWWHYLLHTVYSGIILVIITIRTISTIMILSFFIFIFIACILVVFKQSRQLGKDSLISDDGLEFLGLGVHERLYTLEVGL